MLNGEEVIDTEDIPEDQLVTFKREETGYILEEMCKVVSAPYSEEFFSEPDWYKQYTWTPSEAAKFTKWVADYLKRRHRGVGKKRSMKEATWFVQNCGWELKQEEAPIIAN